MRRSEKSSIAGGTSRKSATRLRSELPLENLFSAVDVVEVRERAEVLITLLNVREDDLPQAIERELLDRERREDAPEDSAAAKLPVRDVLARGEIAEEPAGERIAGAGRIEDVLQRIRRSGEDGVGRDHHDPVLSSLDDERLRPERKDLSAALHEVRLFRELPYFGLVDDHEIDFTDDPGERLLRGGDPEIHRVERHEPRTAALFEHIHLQLRLDVGEEEDVRRTMLLREEGTEAGEDVELCVAGLRHVQIEAVLAAPEERLLPRAALHA